MYSAFDNYNFFVDTDNVPSGTSSTVSTHWLNFVNRLNLKLTNSSKIGEVTYCCCFLQRPLVSSKGFEKNVLLSYHQILII